MTGLELVVRYLVAWSVRRTREVDPFGDAEVDQALDAKLDRLHRAVARKLARDAGLAALVKQGVAGTVSERTQQRVVQSLTTAADADPAFSASLVDYLEQVRRAERQAGVRLSGVSIVAAG